MGEPKEKEKKKKAGGETDREVKVTSFFFSYLHLRCYELVLLNRTSLDHYMEG